MERIALDQGFVLGMDFMSVTIQDAVHRVDAFEHRFPAMLRFLFKPPP